jgi:hypothetical protein
LLRRVCWDRFVWAMPILQRRFAGCVGRTRNCII